ncbi:MAG: hypothetical protein JSS86_26095 [Cyanobacteria bacterium SZAS LIN-2]|nr:hypothetical protein [Cyanobacteria bacterium SZAS LIN-3]MBS1999830.1 hypothetical protein [Cyanobacteria bacterium SZAS LIN-2]MBS2006426.1 hypothetical protein [Cyanobacteria bacterium SZAS TMP-1]
MKTLHLHAHGHAIDNGAERSTLATVIVPLLIVLLTVATIALEYFLMANAQGHWPMNLPTFVDIPFA